MSFHRVLEGLQAVGELLIKRGSAMGPLVPSIIVLVPGFIVAAWFFRSIAMIKGVPLISVLFVIAALGIVIDYHRRYAFFAKNDPDRLQSEEYRYKTAQMQMIAAKELPNPIPEDELPDPKEKPDAPRSSSEGDEPPASTDTDEEKIA